GVAIKNRALIVEWAIHPGIISYCGMRTGKSSYSDNIGRFSNEFQHCTADGRVTLFGNHRPLFLESIRHHDVVSIMPRNPTILSLLERGAHRRRNPLVGFEFDNAESCIGALLILQEG